MGELGISLPMLFYLVDAILHTFAAFPLTYLLSKTKYECQNIVLVERYSIQAPMLLNS